MEYVLVRFQSGVDAYQESVDGEVQRYCDALGNTLDGYPPLGAAEVTDAQPEKLEWML